MRTERGKWRTGAVPVAPPSITIHGMRFLVAIKTDLVSRAAFFALPVENHCEGVTKRDSLTFLLCAISIRTGNGKNRLDNPAIQSVNTTTTGTKSVMAGRYAATHRALRKR